VQLLSDPGLSTGSSWQLTQLPDTGSEGEHPAGGPAVLSPSDVWAVGRAGESDGAALTLTEYYNGTAWPVSSSLDPGQLAARHPVLGPGPAPRPHSKHGSGQ
jgi:hypothetical protein